MLENGTAPVDAEVQAPPQNDAPEPETQADDAPERVEEGTDDKAEAAKAPEQEPEKESKQPAAWIQRRIDELTRQRHDSDRRARELEGELARYRQPAQEDGEQPQRPQLTHDDVRREAANIVATERFNNECNTIFDKGKESFTDWESALGNFKLVGGLPPALIEMAAATGEAHRVLYELGKNPEEAERIISMPPARAAVAIAKLASQPARAAQLSRAPQPIKPIGSGGGRAEADPEKMSTVEWMAWRAKSAKA